MYTSYPPNKTANLFMVVCSIIAHVGAYITSRAAINEIGGDEYMETKTKNEKLSTDLLERIANDNWEENFDNFFSYLKGNEILKVCEELVKRKYKLV